MEARSIIPDDQLLLEELPWIRGLALRLLADPNDADDVVQEAWLRTQVAQVPFRSRDRLRAWLAGVVRRMARDTVRTRQRRIAREMRVAQQEASRDAADVVARGALLERLLRAVRALPEPRRSTVLLRYMDGYSTTEIARTMKVSEEVVRKRLTRARDHLRLVLGPATDEAASEIRPVEGLRAHSLTLPEVTQEPVLEALGTTTPAPAAAPAPARKVRRALRAATVGGLIGLAVLGVRALRSGPDSSQPAPGLVTTEFEERATSVEPGNESVEQGRASATTDRSELVPPAVAMSSSAEPSTVDAQDAPPLEAAASGDSPDGAPSNGTPPPAAELLSEPAPARLGISLDEGGLDH